MDSESLSDVLASNPKLMGALFTMTLLLAQSGSAAASFGTCPGP